ncbi:MAG: hypothetical protein COA42_17360 [Alteromonadaceae bacterium]|nr:MAG: hypothetical protein COA42_17360 [Alteromonadaceae bacterium]
MNTAQPTRIPAGMKRKRYWLTAAVVIFVLYSFFSIRAIIQELAYAMTPPELPEYQELLTENINPKGWDNNHDAQWFHQTTQGTATLPIPYGWVLALEEPKASPWLTFLGTNKPFMDEYILRLGFIKGTKSKHNPDALPIGLAQTPSIYFPGVDRKDDAMGFTCAACHTGQIVHDKTRYIIDGGPAMTDLGLLTASLGAALAQTALSSKLTVLDGRFERFAEKVLGSNYNVLTRSTLKKQLATTLGILVKQSDTINVTEGFTRLDALNRIGNAVFASDMDRNRNYAPIVAPVNYPHIWTTTWFDWVQYDASIMQPLIRNTGEALGVKAYVNVDAGFDNTTEDYVNITASNINTEASDRERFASSVPVRNLVEIEDWLGGTHPYERKSFDGLKAPAWPSSLPSIVHAKANEGAKLYSELCQGCHLPPVSSPEFWSDKYWSNIEYHQDGELKLTDEKYLNLVVVPVDTIGTDPSQSRVLPERTVDTSGLNLNTEVCTREPLPIDAGGDELGRLVYVPLNDSSTSMFALALGAFVERTNNQWFGQNYITSEKERSRFEGNRPNCLQAAMGYKARPLNGVWATAPFLHNGSIPTLTALLSPQEERPVFVELGDQRFDAENVGIFQGEEITRLNSDYEPEDSDHRTMKDYDRGRFILDTRELGNLNTGHLFDDNSSGKSGVIGRKLSDEERMQIIEYIKTLGPDTKSSGYQPAA